MFVCAAQNRSRGRAQPTGWKTFTILPSVSSLLFSLVFLFLICFFLIRPLCVRVTTALETSGEGSADYTQKALT